ncbi:MAG: GNAT family N-acetyltransferase [Chloroflexota bacterium]|nr:GNAT family N-acetyltransferase [Chloroflexota bacterium]
MLGTRLRIRPYNRRYRGDLLDLSWYSQWTHKHLDWYTISRWLDRDDALIFLAWEGEALVGYIGLSPENDGASWIRLLGLRDGFMPETIVRELWRCAEAKCLELGISNIMVLMVSNWLPAYLRDFGFIYWDDIITFNYLGKHEARPPKPSLKVRPAEMEHLPAIARVDRMAFRRNFRLSQVDLRQALRIAAAATIAEYEGEIVGYQVSTRHCEVGHLARLAVIPGMQKRQIGSALLQRQLRDFEGRGISTISVNTQLSNLPSQRLYQRYGFFRTGFDLEIWNKALPRP